MQLTVATMLFCLVGIMFCVLLVLAGIAKTLKDSGESLSKIAKHFEQTDGKDRD